MPKILMKAVVLAGLVIFIACSPSISCLSPEEKRLENATIGDHSPEWMPDGNAIITHADSRLWMVPVDGSAIERIGSRDRGQLKAAVSPTGMLAYTEERPLRSTGRSSCMPDRGCRRVMLKIAPWGPESTDSNPAFQVTADYDMAWSSYDRLATISLSGTTTLSGRGGNYASVPPLLFPNRPVSRDRLFAIRDAKGPAWSPNGDFVATLVLDGGESQTRPGPWQWFLFLLRSDGAYQKVIPLSPPEFKDHAYDQISEMSAPTWSQDGKRVYYAKRLPDENVPILYAVELESRETQVIATLEPEPGSYEAVKLSPTGEQLLLVSRSVNHHYGEGGNYSEPADGALYTIQSDGQNLRRIWQGYSHASWSPDGQSIAVWTPLLPDDTWLWLIDPAGAVRTPLIKRNEDGDPIAASPP